MFAFPSATGLFSTKDPFDNHFCRRSYRIPLRSQPPFMQIPGSLPSVFMLAFAADFLSLFCFKSLIKLNVHHTRNEILLYFITK